MVFLFVENLSLQSESPSKNIVSENLNVKIVFCPKACRIQRHQKHTHKTHTRLSNVSRQILSFLVYSKGDNIVVDFFFSFDSSF